MEGRIKEKILNLAQLIFEDNQYQRIKNHLVTNKLNSARLIVAEHIDYLSNKIEDEEGLLRHQLELCNEIEDMIIDELVVNVD